MTVIFPNAYITTPTTTPLRGGLLDVASITEDMKWMDVENLSNSFNCLTTGNLTVWPCEEDFEQESKIFDEAEWQDGFRFNSYLGVTCKSIGFSPEEALAEAQRVFLAKETVTVEAQFMAQRFVASAGHWSAPTDITPASGAVKPAVGLALLEQHAGTVYAGVPTIHAARSVGSLLWDSAHLDTEGQMFVSPQGSKVASGPGYGIANQSPAGVAAAAGESWMYATGEVSLARGKVLARWEMDRSTNEVFALVERPYIGVVDCYAAAIRVKVE